MKNIFEEFDENIGLERYYQIIYDKLFPYSTPNNVSVASFPLEGQIFRKGSTFSRVRKLSLEETFRFFKDSVGKDEFYAPKPHKISPKQGRFNTQGASTLYLADHPFVAMKECDIDAGDYFLHSYIEFSIDMRFVAIQPGKNEFTDMIHQLLRSRDTKFYSLINRVNENLLKFEGFQGIAYESVKMNEGYSDPTWGGISTTKNIALSGEYIKDTKLSVSWLCYCGEGLSPIQHILFKPLSNKKKNKITKLKYRENKPLFIRESTKIINELNDGARKAKLLLSKACYSEFNQSPIKILWK